MSRTWKPGDVALVTLDGDEFVAVRGHSLWADRWFIGGPERGSQHGWRDESLDLIRPLVVIDPEDREQVERLVTLALAAAARRFCTTPTPPVAQYVDDMQAVFREYANPTPPKPAEPTDPAARVIDCAGDVWASHDGKWGCLTSGGRRRTWDALVADYAPLEIRP